MTDRGNLPLALGRLRCAAVNDVSGLVGSRALLGRRASQSGRESVLRWPLPFGLARKGLIKRPMLKDSRRGAGEDLSGRRAVPSPASLCAPPAYRIVSKRIN